MRKLGTESLSNLCEVTEVCPTGPMSDSCWSFTAQCGLLVLFGSEVQSRESLRNGCQKHQGGWAENGSLPFQNCELLNGKTEAVNPHPLRYKAWLLTRVRSFGDTWILVLWLFHPVSFGEDLRRSVLKWQAELVHIVYGHLWAQGEAVGGGGVLTKVTLQRGA